MRSIYVLAALGLVPLSADVLYGQRGEPLTRAFSYVLGDDRPRLGIATRSSGRRDTLGLLVSEVTRGSPAEKAGIEEGDRLVSVNGVNLRLSRDDAEDEAMAGVATRRLTRELAKHKAGDAVELRVYRDGQTRSIRATLADPADMEGEFRSARSIRTALTDRAVLGLSLGGMGSRRDTLGVLVVGVTDSGPAALAGIDEGDRIAAINGVDLRVDREDAGDWESSSARVRRLNRAMDSVKPGDDVELRVHSQGQTRTVRAKAARAGDLRGRNGFFFDGGFMGGDGVRIFRAPSMPLGTRLLQPSVKIQPRILYSSPRISVDAEARVRADARVREILERTAEQSRATRIRTEEAVRRSEEAMRRALETRLRRLRLRSDIDVEDTVWEARIAPRAPAARAAPRSGVVTATAVPALRRPYASTAASGSRAPLAASTAPRGLVASVRPAARFTRVPPAAADGNDHIVVSGLRLAPVERDLATYLGEGTERGLMVLERSSRWPGLHEGDVILAIDGRSVRGVDGSTSVALRSVSRTVVDVVRGGRRIAVTIDRE